MESFGVEVDCTPDFADRFEIVPQPYTAREYAIEPDASAASYSWRRPR